MYGETACFKWTCVTIDGSFGAGGTMGDAAMVGVMGGAIGDVGSGGGEAANAVEFGSATGVGGSTAERSRLSGKVMGMVIGKVTTKPVKEALLTWSLSAALSGVGDRGSRATS